MTVFVGVGVRYVHPQAPLDIVPLPEILVTLIAHNCPYIDEYCVNTGTEITLDVP